MSDSSRKAYPDFGGLASRKTGRAASVYFSVPSLVESSNWPANYRLLLLEMLKENKFGTELWLAQGKIAARLGWHYTTVQRMIDRLQRGHQFGRKRTVQCEAALELLHEANIRVGGKLRRSRTYVLRSSSLRARPTEKEIEDATPRAVCPLPTRPERPIPPASAPKAAPREHRSPERQFKPKLSKPDTAKFVAQMKALMQGRTRHVEQVGGFGFDLRPDDPRYRAPMHWREALATVAKAWNRTPDVILEAIKGWGYQFDETEGP